MLCNALALASMYTDHPKATIDELIAHLKECPAYTDDTEVLS